MLFRQQEDFLARTTETLMRVGQQAGFGRQAVADCINNQALLDKLAASRDYARDVLKIPGTPTFFLNGHMLATTPSFEQFDSELASLLKR